MQSKLAHVRRLLAEGYELADIDTDERAMEAMFLRGTQRVVIRFSSAEAEALLLMRGPLFAR